MRWTALLGSLLLLATAACDRDASKPPAPEAKPSQGPARPALSPELLQLIRSSTLGASSGSAEVPVEVRFELHDVPQSGQPFTLPIALLPADAIPSVKVEASGAEGLTVLEPTTPVALDKLVACIASSSRPPPTARGSRSSTSR
jgi:hypothetical protein